MKKQSKLNTAKLIKKISRNEFRLKPTQVIKSKKLYTRKAKHKQIYAEG